MLRSIDPSSERFLAGLTEINRRLERAQRQVTTGLRITSAADDPDQVSNLLGTRLELEQTQQIRMNLGRVKAETGAAEQALQSALEVLDRATVLGAQGANGIQTAETRRSIAGEVRALLEQLVGISRVTVEGRYIFSGDSDQQPPYTLDWTQASPVGLYGGSPSTRQIMHPSGTLFAVAKTAEEIFDDTANHASVFAAVDHLRLALENNDQAAINSSLAELRGAGQHLNTQLAWYGTVQNRVDEATDCAHRTEVRLRTALSEIESADLTAAILELNQARFQQQAALEARAQLPRNSLFDYL